MRPACGWAGDATSETCAIKCLKANRPFPGLIKAVKTCQGIRSFVCSW